MRTKKILALLLALGLLLAGCQQDGAPPDEERAAEQLAGEEQPTEVPHEFDSMAALLAWTEQRHRAIVKPEPDYAQYLGQAAEGRYSIFDYMEEAPFVQNAPLTLDEALEDIDVLFDILRSTYGMYFYLGGDKAFGAARANLESVLESLEGMNMLNASSLEAMLLEHLRFIEDGHFRINQTALRDPVIAYVYNDVPFVQLEGGGFAEADSGRLVESVDGHQDLGELFKLSISPEGEIVHYPVVLTTENPEEYDENLLVRYADGSEQELHLAEWSSGYGAGSDLVELRYNGDIPVVYVQNMGYDRADEDRMLGARFLEIAEELADEPVVVVDLRSNGGGNGVLPVKWLEIFTGEIVPTNFTSLNYLTEEDFIRYGTDTTNYTHVPTDELVEYGGWEQLNDRYYLSYAQPDRFVSNDRLLILLIGKNSMSSAEVMVDLVHNMENTLVVGNNTYGTLVSNAYARIVLPNSHVAVQLGSNLCVFPDDYFEEFVGFEPDLWVNGGDAEELVMRLLARHPFEGT